MYNIIQGLMDTYTNPKKPLVSLDSKVPDKIYLNPSSAGVFGQGSPALGACTKKVWLDKKGYAKSNPLTPYNHLQFDFGNMIEDWVIQKYKDMGIYLDSNVKIIDNSLSISGELDIVHTNPEDSTIEFSEIKSYNGSFAQNAKSILGSKDNNPTPKIEHMLQVATYLLVLKRYDIKVGNLIYIDKSLGGVYNHKQFAVYMHNNQFFYDTIFYGELTTFKEERFAASDILERNAAVLQLIDLDYVPDPDYKIQYTNQEVEDAYLRGDLSKYKYDKYKKATFPDPIGDYQCQYCPFGPGPDGNSTCRNITNDTK